MPLDHPAAPLGELEPFVNPEVVLANKFPFVELEPKLVNSSAWLEPCDSLWAGELRECLTPSADVFDIMDTNSGL